MTKIASYTICHYGKDYLSYALRSVENVVDKSYIFWTNHPSHGHSSSLVNPETRDEVISSIPQSQWNKVTWVDTEGFYNEGPQRDYAINMLQRDGIDIAVVLDYDEIWETVILEKAIKHVWDSNNSRHFLINMVHFWRSFNYACVDDGWPVRLIDTRHIKGTQYISRDDIGRVYHFGYAVTDEILKYKMSLHGHKDELRPNWYEEKWLAWPPPKDCHPTNGIKQDGEGWWNPEPFDKTQLPEIMRHHKWYNVEKIE